MTHEMTKNVELELRAEVPQHILSTIADSLQSRGKLVSKTRRLSVMSFGKIGQTEIDIRVRATNGASEVVVKSGDLHGQNRVEVSQRITREQFIGMVRIVAQFGFPLEVAERETENFQLKNGIMASLVRAGPIAYVEIEKMTNQENLERDRQRLHRVVAHLGVTPIDSRKDFDDLCRRLSEAVDWKFDRSPEHYARLERLLEKYSGSTSSTVRSKKGEHGRRHPRRE